MQQLERAKIWKPCSKTHPAQTGKKKRKKHPRKKRKRIDPQINEQLKKMLMISKNAIPSGEKLCACKQGVHSSREMERRAADFAFVCDGNAFWRLSTAMRSTSGCAPRVELLSHLPVTDAIIDRERRG